MRVRNWNRNTDYETIVGWWKAHDCTADYVVPSRRLPPSGWIVEDEDGTPICVTWLYYFSHASGALLGSIVSNPSVDAKLRAKALDLLFLRVTSDADRNHAEAIIGITTREGFVRKLKSHGFVQTTKHSVEFQRERGEHG